MAQNQMSIAAVYLRGRATQENSEYSANAPCVGLVSLLGSIWTYVPGA